MGVLQFALGNAPSRRQSLPAAATTPPAKCRLASASLRNADEMKIGLMERNDSRTGARTSLKDKAISFMTRIKENVSAFFDRHFSLENKAAAKTKTVAPLAPAASASAAFAPASLDTLKAIGSVVIDAAKSSETNAGLFRIVPAKTDSNYLKEALAKNEEVNVAGLYRDVAASHLKEEFRELGPSFATFDALQGLEKKFSAASSNEDKQAIALEAIETFKKGSSEPERLSVLLDILTECFVYADKDKDNVMSQYGLATFTTAVASALLPKLDVSGLSGKEATDAMAKTVANNKECGGILTMLLSSKISE